MRYLEDERPNSPESRIVLTYLNDPFGRRIAKQINGTTVEKYLWAGRTTLLAVYDGNDNLLQRYTYADARMPVSMTAGGATYHLLTDQVGTLRAVADTSGNIVKRIDYDSFGNIIADSNPAFSVLFGFAGGLHDRDTGLVRFGARDYDPAIGRWTAKDPIDFAGGDTNLYAYVMNDPVNLVDPLGLEPPPYPTSPGGTVSAHNPFATITRMNVATASGILSPYTFHDLVQTNGPWDYKQGDPSWEDFGNYNFGATGAATGLFTLETLQREAGRVQTCHDPKWGNPKTGPPYGDDPNDQRWIKQGWDDYWSGMYGPPRSPSALYGVPLQYWGGAYSRSR
jgi:RHS repeat-associated protein